jgi:GntR family transcriptional regulator
VPVPDLADPRPPYMQIADDLRAKIGDGRYQPGGKLPSNKAMATEYSTSTETVRRALRLLTDEGLIASHSTLGTFVLRSPAEARTALTVAELDGAMRKMESRLRGEIADLREYTETLEARLMAVEERERDRLHGRADRPPGREVG